MIVELTRGETEPVMKKVWAWSVVLAENTNYFEISQIKYLTLA